MLDRAECIQDSIASEPLRKTAYTLDCELSPVLEPSTKVGIRYLNEIEFTNVVLYF